MRALTLICLFVLSTSYAFAYPITVTSCADKVQFGRAPRRVVVHDVNMSEMLFVLGLQSRIVGLTGISGWGKVSRHFKVLRGTLPELAPRYVTLEQLMAVDADLFVAGWNYGLRLGGDVTPQSLASVGIPTLVLSETCFRLGHKAFPVSLERLLYADMQRLGRVFNREQRANQLIAQWTQRVARVQARVQRQPRVSVFLYDNGSDAPFTAGKDALITEMIRLAGGRNIMRDMPTNWRRTSWEIVALRRPEAFILIDYGHGTAQSQADIEHNALLASLPAVKSRRFLTLRYDEITPGPEDITAIEDMALFFHSVGSK